jgi:pimeloyl-ACP methyl ester carboxylesterase
MTGAYRPLREARDLALPVRGLTYHVNAWGDASLATPERPPLLMLHGWMDVGASFQFVVDALARTEGARRYVLAPDWRGFGGTSNGGSDSYWFPDYLGDLDALADALAPGQPFDLLGHSMGGNVVMSYAGIRPGRIRRLVNLEGFGLPDMSADRAPERAAKWLDELKTPQAFSPYADAQAVAARLRKNNPRLPADKAAWLATHWAEPRADGQWHLRADPAHRRVNPVPYRAAEAVAAWRAIEAPVLWVEGAQTDMRKWWGDRYPRAEFDARLAQVRGVQSVTLEDAGHMLHHDQPEALAAALARFLN